MENQIREIISLVRLHDANNKTNENELYLDIAKQINDILDKEGKDNAN